MAKTSLKAKFKNAIMFPFMKVIDLLKKLTLPFRSSKRWQRARKSFLKSPFKGYFKDSYNELKQVEWPNRATSWKLTGTVIVFSAAFAVLTTLLDIGFEKIAKKIFLN